MNDEEKDTTTTHSAESLEGALARIAQLEKINRDLKSEKQAVKAKSIAPDDITRALEGEQPEDSRLFRLYEELKASREKATAAETREKQLTAKLKEVSDQFGTATARLDRLDFEKAVRDNGGEAFLDDLFDVAVDSLVPFLGKTPDGKVAVMKSGTPWLTEAGKPVEIRELVADMSPNGDHKLTGINRPSLFKAKEGKEPESRPYQPNWEPLGTASGDPNKFDLDGVLKAARGY